MIRRLLVLSAALFLSVVSAASLRSQVFQTRPTTCPISWRTIGDIIFFHDHYWAGTRWTTSPGQIGTAVFTGSPNPMVSENGNAIWWNPAFLGYCEATDYHWPDGTMTSEFNIQYLAEYGDVVVKDPCETETDLSTVISDVGYDPYSPGGCGDPGSGGGGGGGGGTDIESRCTWESITIEISYDDGVTWTVWWAGWTLVCT